MKFRCPLCFLTALLLVSGCAGKEDGKKYPSEYEPPSSPKMSKLRLPSSPGEQVAVDSSGLVQIDYNDIGSGYLQVKFLYKPGKRMRLRVTKDGVGNIVYNFTKEDEYETFPFEQGSGIYPIKVLENRPGKTYMITLTLSVDVKLENERIPFLYPNQTVNYDSHTVAVKGAFDLTKDDDTASRRTATLYNYTADSISRDSKKAKEVEDIYVLPAVDETPESRRGIRFDYAALSATMLRGQQIPARLIAGNTMTEYHAWVEVYVEGKGWINPGILLHAKKWNRMDPTFGTSDVDHKNDYEDKHYYQEESGMAHTTLRSEEMFDFCTQVPMIFTDGLSVEEGPEIIEGDIDSPHMKEAAAYLLEKVYVISSFSTTLGGAPYFDTHVKKMAETGEVSDYLNNAIRELVLCYERGSDLKQSLKEALTYPSILLLMMQAAIGITIWKVLPIFEKVLLHIGVAFQGTVASMIRSGQSFVTASSTILTLFLLGGTLLAVTFRKSGGESFLSHLSMTKWLYHDMVMVKITYALSLFIMGGYEMEEALEYLTDVVGNEAAQKKIDTCHSDMQEGKSSSRCPREQASYQGVHASMVIAGFHSGKSDKVMQKVNALYEKDADTSISALLNTTEPVTVIILSAIVGIILLSVMLPLMSIISPIG